MFGLENISYVFFLFVNVVFFKKYDWMISIIWK